MHGISAEYKTHRSCLYIPPSPRNARRMHRAIFLLGLAVAAATPAGGADTPARGLLRRGNTLTVITECTPAGGEVQPATAEHPVYVLVHPAGRHDYGRPVAGEDAPPAADLQRDLDAALASAHYLPADQRHPPALLLFLNWGIHASPGYAAQDPDYGNLLDRAALVAGRAFARELARVLEQDDMSGASHSKRPWGFQQKGMTPVTPAVLFQGFSPLESFRRRSTLNERLLTQISQDCYYVIVSAFDYTALARGDRRLLWRTKLTTQTIGSTMTAALPALIQAGTRHFGRPMAAPELLTVGGK